MQARSLSLLLCALLSALLSLPLTQLSAQAPPRQPNANATYQLLRHMLPGGETAQVKEFKLKRDAAEFTFHSGAFAFYGEANGKITGAVFRGQGSLHLVPPIEQEKRSIALLTKEQALDEVFDTAVLRFTDDTAAEIRKASTGKGSPDGAFTTTGQQFAEAMRTKRHWNLDARLLEDVMSPSQRGFFLASIDGKKYASKMIFILDPHGAPDVSPEEVELLTWNDLRQGIWAAFHLEGEYKNGIADGNEANSTYTIDHQDLDTSIAKNGAIQAIAKTTVKSHVDGLAVVPLRLYPELRVSSIRTRDGAQLDFIQEGKDYDPDFAIILPAPLKRDEQIELQVSYAGKNAVHERGGDNYYLDGGARESWYPSSKEGGLGSYATYKMIFRVPKGIELIATGKPGHQSNENGQSVSEWSSTIPIPVAGFNLGKFKHEEVTLKDGFVLTAYANTSVPDNVAGLLSSVDGEAGIHADFSTEAPMVLGNMSTTGMLKPALAQGQVAIELYTHYYGPLQFTNLALTQQTACNYGQSWPMLVYLPICGFWDSTIQHQLGLDSDLMYWKVVTPHEVAHQWWGQTVSFRSYRDQWMSEGFADFSASLFLQIVNKNTKEFHDFWQQQKHMLIDKNAQGFRPIDVGPVTMGYRLVNTRSGQDVYRSLVYPKGAYILHMIRMMNWSPREGDRWLEETLQDFVSTYRARPASTEDFKAILEKHMPPIMDLDHNHRLDWFFNEYVYGTALPHYSFAADLQQNSDGASAHLHLVQSNVDSSFKMIVPLYAELGDGHTVRLGAIPIAGNSTFDQTIKIPTSGTPIKRLVINVYNDVLCTQD